MPGGGNAARRAELDALALRARSEGNTVLGTLVDFYLLTWTFEDHLMRGHRRDALTTLRNTDARLRAMMRENRHSRRVRTASSSRGARCAVEIRTRRCG